MFAVEHLSEGRSYCTRFVRVRQPVRAAGAASAGSADGDGADGSDADADAVWGPEEAEGELGRVCFAAMVSFKRDEPEGVRHQVDGGLEEFRSVIGGRRPDEWEACPAIDTPW